MLPRKYALTLEEVVGIILSLFIIVIIVALFVGCRKFRAKRHQSRNGGRNLLIQNEFDKEHIMMKPTRNGTQKLNNHEVMAREQDLPLLSQHPSSISPTVTETPFNYMDTIRHYGAAAEELETLPRISQDYIQNIQKPVATVAPSMMTDRDMNLKDNYFKRRKSPCSDINRPGSMTSGYFRPNKLSVILPPDGAEDPCHSELSVEDDCQRYHWDCSDWAGPAAGQPGMLEIASMGQMGQPLMVSQPPNGWDNDSAKLMQPDQPIDPTRDIETLPEDDKDADDVGDDAGSVVSSECESQLGAVYPDASPMHQTNKSIEELLMANEMNYADEDNGSVDIPNIYDYKLHLNNYLPTYHLGSDPDTDEATPMLGRHPRPFPNLTSSPEVPRYATIGQNLQQNPPSQDPEASARKSGPLRGLILPPVVTNTGQSTDKLCEIEDEDEDVNGEVSAMKRAPSPRVTRV